MERIAKQGVHYYASLMLQEVKHGIFTRHGGVSDAPWASLNLGGTVGDPPSAVRRNHEIMHEVLDLNEESSCTTWLVHGVDVVIAEKPVEGRRWIARADGLMTNKPDIPLVMRYADCVPLLFHDPTKQVIGIAHAGWRGTVNGMGSQMIRAMQQAYGSQPDEIRVVIGPSISQECFQVGEEVIEALAEQFGDVDGLVERDPSDGTAYVDLWEANRIDVAQSGVKHIEVSGICTHKNKQDFYSHRAEKGKTGRFGAVISL